MQATYWESKYTDGTTKDGGRQDLYSTDVNVSQVDVTQLEQFSIAGNTNTDTYYVPWGKWYRNGVEYAYTYPMQYGMHDGTTLTVDWDTTNNCLKLLQTAYTGNATPIL